MACVNTFSVCVLLAISASLATDAEELGVNATVQDHCPLCQGNSGKITYWPFSGCSAVCGAKDEYGNCCCLSGWGNCPSAAVAKNVIGKQQIKAEVQKNSTDFQNTTAMVKTEAAVKVQDHCPLCQGNSGKITYWPFSGCSAVCGAKDEFGNCCCLSGWGNCPSAAVAKNEIGKQQIEPEVQKNSTDIQNTAAMVKTEAAVKVQDHCPLCQGNSGKITYWPFSGCSAVCGAKDEYGNCCCLSGWGNCPSAAVAENVIGKQQIKPEVRKNSTDIQNTTAMVKTEAAVKVQDHCPLCQGNSGSITYWPFSGCNAACGAKDQYGTCCCLAGWGNCPSSAVASTVNGTKQIKPEFQKNSTEIQKTTATVKTQAALKVQDSCPMCQGNSGAITYWPFSGCNAACGAKDEYGTCCCLAGWGNCPSTEVQGNVKEIMV